MSEDVKLRQVKAQNISGVMPSGVLATDEKPEFKWVAPTELYVEERYQRNISSQSTKLIRRIVKNFNWRQFKPPVCAYGAGGKLFVIDGQHTALAAASHPKITKIPVMVVDAASIQNRAEAFMGHNRDRLAITSAQLFYSSVAAGDPVALAAEKALKATGCIVLRSPPPVYVEGQTLAAGALMKITERKGEKGLTRLLQILMEAKRAPIVGNELKAVAILLWDRDLRDRFDDEDLIDVIRSRTIAEWEKVAETQVRKGQNISLHKAIAFAWFRRVPKKRRKADDKSDT